LIQLSKFSHQDPSNISIDQTMLIATGSADTNAYVFDISRDVFFFFFLSFL